MPSNTHSRIHTIAEIITILAAIVAILAFFGIKGYEQIQQTIKDLTKSSPDDPYPASTPSATDTPIPIPMPTANLVNSNPVPTPTLGRPTYNPSSAENLKERATEIRLSEQAAIWQTQTATVAH